MKPPSSLHRLVLITNGLNGQHGGIQRVNRALLDALREDPCPTTFWSSNDDPVGSDFASEPRLAFHCFGGRHRAMGWQALTRALPNRVGGIFCFHLALAPIAAILSWRTGAPFRVFLHGVEAWRDLSWKQRMALRRAASLDANSAYTLRTFHQRHSEFSKKAGKILPLGLDANFVQSRFAGEEFSARFADPFFLSVARFAEDYKGEGVLLEAFAKVHRRHSRASLVCVGEGPTRARWEAEASRLGLSRAVSFPGRLSDSELRVLYDRCLAFAMLSEGEGFGIVYAEAMFHAKPCVATDADASQELVRNEVTGLTVPPRDATATERALTRLLEEPALARKLGEEGARRVRESFMPASFQKRLREYVAC